jgi:hypothetical protein
MPPSRWSVADLLDLEFLLHLDEGEDMGRLVARDREMYASLPNKAETDAALLRSWLKCRMKEAEQDGAVLPGRLWRELMLIFGAVIVVAGLISGSGLAFSLLAYSGTEPVNVAAYFAVFVLLQLALFLLLAGSLLCSTLQGGSILTTSILYRLAGRLFFRLLDRLMTAAQRRAATLSAETRLHWAAQLGSIKKLQQRHGLLLLRPFFLLAQMFGISFNVGVLTVTLLKVIGSDLAFGWQSTLQLNAAAVHAVVGWISLPWAWLAPSCVPTPAQIEGSRLILKDGIYHLASRDLASWWPFLCLSVLCYGLLPRLALLASGLLQQRRDLATLDFHQGYFRQIIHRMGAPKISTAAPAEKATALAMRIKEHLLASDRPPSPPASDEAVIALFPDELLASCRIEVLAKQLSALTGYQVGQLLPFGASDKSEEEELAAFQAALETRQCKDVLILIEAWLPPVQEMLVWLCSVRRCLGPKPAILLVLIGKPIGRHVLAAPQPQDIRIWRLKLYQLDEQNLHLIMFAK